jgi:hypothetical protein
MQYQSLQPLRLGLGFFQGPKPAGPPRRETGLAESSYKPTFPGPSNVATSAVLLRPTRMAPPRRLTRRAGQLEWSCFSNLAMIMHHDAIVEQDARTLA